ncbi:MAG: YndJ family transporter [Verrucomicrobia bacterium]|nr:YndJ family transporter [Verrucomicrobiota bacterium]
MISAKWRAAIGAVVWIGFALLTVPSLHHGAWAVAAVLLSALVIAPLALELTEEAPRGGKWPARLASWVRVGQLPAALLLAVAGWMTPGPEAALVALPWVVFCGVVAALGWSRMRAGGWRRPMESLCGDVSLMYLGVGGAWLFADRAGYRPLNFDPAIVTLTAVHFHYAGLLLPMLAGRVLKVYWMSRFASRAAVGVILGVPAVAVGITTTQLGWGPAIEGAAGWGLALAGMMVAILHVRLATEAGQPWLVRGLFFVAGAALFYGMLLAGLYATRAFFAPLPWLDLTWMRALHGTANALGFGLCGVLAWRGRGK